MVTKPKPMDEDGIPYLTDNMKRALDKGEELPIEKLVSDEAAAMVHAERERRRKPVRMDTLQPMSKVEAARRMTFDGGSLPAAPRTTPVIPRPFERPRAVVSTEGGHQKTWQNVAAEDIEVEDIITDLGRVIEVTDQIRHETVAGVPSVAVGVDIIVVGAGGKIAVFEPHEQVRVFRK